MKLRRIAMSAAGAALMIGSWTVVQARSVHPSGSGTPTVVVDYFNNGKLLGTNTSPLAGFDLSWKKTGCAGKWLAKPVVVLSEAAGRINSAPLPAPCNGEKAPVIHNARHSTPIETVDVLGWLVTGSSWWIGWSVTGTGHGPVSSAMAQGTTGIHIYLYGGNAFTKEMAVSDTGKVMAVKPANKIPAGANQAFIHIQATGSA